MPILGVELYFQVDERAVLKHFDWPEDKVDVIRVGAATYEDLKKILDRVEKGVEINDDLSLNELLQKLQATLQK